MKKYAYIGKEIKSIAFGQIRILPSLTAYWYKPDGSFRRCPTELKDTELFIDIEDLKMTVRCKGMDVKGNVIFDVLPMKLRT